MAYKPGVVAPQTGIYWCSVCKLPGRFERGEALPECRNKCGRGGWDFVLADAPEAAPDSGPAQG